MSAFIGPIHYWLYGKIRVVRQREDYIYQKASAVCGTVAEELREQAVQSYGEPLPDRDLGELIDHNNIHGWLQRQINITESREAAFIKELLAVCGGAAEELVGQAFREHGRITGESARAQGKYDLATAPGIYKALNDYYLNGMPCDQGDMVMQSQADSLVWQSGACLQEPNWKRAGIDAGVMAEFYRNWFEGFVGGVNPEYGFRAAGGAANRFEIYRRQSG